MPKSNQEVIGDARWIVDRAAPLGPPGGFGQVFAGASSDGNTPVAIKLVETKVSVPSELTRRELDIVERLRQIEATHLVRLHDAGPTKTGFFVVMERADHSLADSLKQSERLPVEVLTEIATGLEELHGAGVIHRDLKPGNILFVDGTWKLADFGIARDVLCETGTLTFAGAGTPPYMSPEQWQSKSPTVKTDLYALGCVAFELLAGSMPFLGPSRDDFRRQHLEAAVPHLPEEIPAGLRGLVLRLLMKNPADRPQDARAVRERLVKVTASPSEVAQRLQALSARHDEQLTVEESERLKQEARLAAMIEQSRQAVADLEEIVSDAVEELSLALDGVSSRSWEHERKWRIATDHAQLVIELWRDRFGDIDDPLRFIPAIGEVGASNRRRQSTIALANVVCRVRDDRLRWELMRARPGLGQAFRDMPHGTELGLGEGEFQRDYERGLLPDLNAIHVYQLTTTPFTPAAIVALFEEALALTEPPTPQSSRLRW